MSVSFDCLNSHVRACQVENSFGEQIFFLFPTDDFHALI